MVSQQSGKRGMGMLSHAAEGGHHVRHARILGCTSEGMFMYFPNLCVLVLKLQSGGMQGGGVFEK